MNPVGLCFTKRSRIDNQNNNTNSQSHFYRADFHAKADSFESSNKKTVAQKISQFFSEIKATFSSDDSYFPEIKKVPRKQIIEEHEDIDEMVAVIKACDTKGRLARLVAKLGIDEVYAYIIGKNHNENVIKYLSNLNENEYDTLTDAYCTYNTARGLLKQQGLDENDLETLVQNITLLKQGMAPEFPIKTDN